MKFSKAFIAAFLAFVGVSQGIAVVDPELTQQLSMTGTADILINFPPFDFSTKAPGWNAYPKTNSKQEALAARGARRQMVFELLSEYSAASHADALEFLRRKGLEAESNWINNSIYVKNAPADAIQELAQLNNVQEITLDKIVATIEHPIMGAETEGPSYVMGDAEPTIEWNIKQINAHSSWPIVDGTGITIANIDTGVLFSHEALVDGYRGTQDKANATYVHDYNWYDPRKQYKQPTDTNGHGTHTMGTIIGKVDAKKYHIGVAPGAKWIASRGCAGFGCSNQDLLASAQFVMCPTKLDGKEPDCHRGADTVSNSWGGGRGDTFFKAPVDAWRAAGIIPVFSQGNSGPRCASANSPADLETVIGVGSSNKDYRLSSFSSRGPGVIKQFFSKQKPDITAPGEAVVSSYRDGKYRSFSGTSMAAPAITGVVALTLAANPAQDYDDVYKVLISTAMKTDLQAPAGGITVCANVTYKEFPNYFYGHGLIDSLPAVKKAKGGKKEGSEGTSEEQMNAMFASLLRIALNLNM